jgi:hypothetical protein
MPDETLIQDDMAQEDFYQHEEEQPSGDFTNDGLGVSLALKQE